MTATASGDDGNARQDAYDDFDYDGSGQPEDSTGFFEEARGLPDWRNYRSADIFRNLENLLDFELLVEVPRMYQWVGSDWAPSVVSRMYEEVMNVLESAEFYSSERIETILSQTQAGVRYVDDEFQFSVFFDEYGLHVERQGSSLERFYHWYRRIMPSLTSLVNRILTAVTDVVRGTSTGAGASGSARPELRPVALSYRFRFLAYDFTLPPSEDVERNDVILRRLLKVVPGADGTLQDAGALQNSDSVSRLDLSLSRFVEDLPRVWAREIYRIQAPSNRRYTTLWLDFVYRGETFETPQGDRRKFEPDVFLRSYELPIVQFLQGRVIKGFLSQLTANTVFRTSAGSLP